MIRISVFLVIALFSFAFFIPVNSEAIIINDNYIGSDSHGYGDVIGNVGDFGIDWLDVSITGNLMNVVIQTGYTGSDRWGVTEYGDFFISTDGWNPYGSAPYIADNHANGEVWEYAFDVQSGSLYDITDAQAQLNNILLAEDTMPTSGYVFRNGQETAIDTTGLTAWSVGTAGTYNGTNYSFIIDISGLNWELSDLGFHWAAATCANDVIEGSAAPVPEPATMLLLGTGLIGLAGCGRKKFKKKN